MDIFFFFCFALGCSPATIYLFKVNKRNTRTRYEICSKSTKRHQNDVTGVVLASLLLALKIFHTIFCFYCYFEQVIVVCWAAYQLITLFTGRRETPVFIRLISNSNRGNVLLFPVDFGHKGIIIDKGLTNIELKDKYVVVFLYTLVINSSLLASVLYQTHSFILSNQYNLPRCHQISKFGFPKDVFQLLYVQVHTPNMWCRGEIFF